jgi:4-methyl-5(b-hydroxyethyl)-thiazole monophosphate biosynthesis
LADGIFSEQNFEKNCFLFLPGGLPGTTNLDNHQGLKDLIQNQATKGNKMAAICAAPSVFGKMGLLADKEAVCYPGFEKQLLNATLMKEQVVCADNVYTAKAAGAALEFALMIVSDLKGKNIADSIRAAMFIK